jgi:hypothetical protein
MYEIVSDKEINLRKKKRLSSQNLIIQSYLEKGKIKGIITYT